MFFLEKILSNWNIGALVIILLTNLLLAQWQQQNKIAKQATIDSKHTQINISPIIEIQSLSLLKVPKKTSLVPGASGPKQLSQPAKTPPPTVVKPQLTNTLLPSKPKVNPSPLAQKKIQPSPLTDNKQQ